jgi:hypothetical protein
MKMNCSKNHYYQPKNHFFIEKQKLGTPATAVAAGGSTQAPQGK